MRYTGTTVRGIRTPIIKDGDNLIQIVVDSVLRASKGENFDLKDRDIVGVTEAVVSICQHNYVTVDDIAREIKEKFGDEEIGLVFPILSRNRFSLILEAVVKATKKIHILFSYPSDEVGNNLIDPEKVDKMGINPFSGSFDEKEYRDLFGFDFKHEFTGIDYVDYYKDFDNDNISIYFSNDPSYILKYTKNVLACDIHTRERTKRILKENGGKIVFGLDEICSKKTDEHGYNESYGLLGSNKVGDEKLKLFPRDGEVFVNNVQMRLKELTGKNIEVLIYGDGAFKDPVGKIWELADPVVSPGFTDGLKGRPKEIKLKYVSENWNGKGDLSEYVKSMIKEKNTEKYIVEKSFGTTPRQITDLLGSLCDLTSGSGDKGTPVILIQGYFDDYTVE